MIYHEWPDMLQYMDKDVKIYHIPGNIILFRSGLANLSTHIMLQNGLANLSINIMLRNGLANLSINIILRNSLANLSANIMLRNGLTKSLKSSFQSVYRCLQLVQRQL